MFGKDEDGWILTRKQMLTDAEFDAYEKQFKSLMPTWGGNLSRHEQGTERAPDCTYNPEVYA